MNAKLISCADLDDRISIGHIARAALKHGDPRGWLVKMTENYVVPEYIRYLASQMIVVIDRPESDKERLLRLRAALKKNQIMLPRNLVAPGSPCC